jgi:hypothetical protein
VAGGSCQSPDRGILSGGAAIEKVEADPVLTGTGKDGR